jgi:hypothetical protein
MVYFANAAVLPSFVANDGNACVGVALGRGVVDDEVRGCAAWGEGLIGERRCFEAKLAGYRVRAARLSEDEKV